MEIKAAHAFFDQTFQHLVRTRKDRQPGGQCLDERHSLCLRGRRTDKSFTDGVVGRHLLRRNRTGKDDAVDDPFLLRLLLQLIQRRPAAHDHDAAVGITDICRAADDHIDALLRGDPPQIRDDPVFLTHPMTLFDLRAKLRRDMRVRETIQIEPRRDDIDRPRHPIAQQLLLRLLAGRDDAGNRIAQIARQRMHRFLADLFHAFQIEKIDIMRIILIHRMIRIDDRDMQAVPQDAAEDPYRKLLLHMDHIQMQILHLFLHLKMIWGAQCITIQLLQLQSRHADHIAFPMRMQRVLLSGHDIYFMAGCFQTLLQRHDRRNHTIDIRCICICENTYPHHSTSSC